MHESGKPGRPKQRGALTPEQQVFIDLVRTEGEKMFELNAFLREHDLSEPQYNVLRILRGAGREGLPCGQITERMLTRLPDITRLVDRLAGEGYVTRARAKEDRRINLVRITARGLKLLEKLDGPIRKLHGKQFSRLSRREIEELGRLLKKARGG